MRKCFFIILIITGALSLLTACAGKTEPDIPPAVVESPISVTEPAEADIIAAEPAVDPLDELASELSDFWQKIDGSTATIPLTAALYGQFGIGGRPPEHRTTHDAYRRLFNRDVDLIFVTYPSAEEFLYAEEQGIELEIIPIAKDALVFLVNIENPLDGLTLPQIRDIYTGKTTNWKALGGLDEDIIPYQRSEGSGSQTLLLKLVMGSQAPMQPPSEWRPVSMGELVEFVSDYDNSRGAIGYSVFYYVNNMYGNSRFKLLSIDGVPPSRNTIARGDYALEDHYYAVIRQDTPPDSPARQLIDWLLSEEGQTLAVRAGYIPLAPLEGVWPDDDTDPIYLGDADNSSGTGGAVLKDGTDNIVTGGVRRPLSDIFFDGFNYIRYINSAIINQLQLMYDYEIGDTSTVEEQFSKRPFSGIPNDYPHYELVNKQDWVYLRVNFHRDNPFFNGSRSFDIRLTADISPYGAGLQGYSVTYDYAGLLMPDVKLFKLSVNIPESPKIAARINEQLAAWVKGFAGNKVALKLLQEFAAWYYCTPEQPYNFQPIHSIWRDYLSVSYTLDTRGGPDFYMPTIHTMCFDINTGEAVKLADKLPRDLLYTAENCSIFEPIIRYVGKIGDSFTYQEHMQQGFVPAAGSVVNMAWLNYGKINLLLTEPDGRVLQAVFWDEIE